MKKQGSTRNFTLLVILRCKFKQNRSGARWVQTPLRLRIFLKIRRKSKETFKFFYKNLEGEIIYIAEKIIQNQRKIVCI